MSIKTPRWNPELFEDLEIGLTPQESAVRVLRFTTEERDDMTRQWKAMIILAHRSGVPAADIAGAAGISPEEVNEICNGPGRKPESGAS